MKFYICRAEKYSCGGCGPDYDIRAAVVANTEYEALGLLLTDYPMTYSEDWEITEASAYQPRPRVYEIYFER